MAEKYGNQFAEKNVRRMMRSAEVFSDFAIVAPVVRQLSWSHFLMLLPLKSEGSRVITTVVVAAVAVGAF